MPITAKFAGKCRVCNKYYEVGDQVDKIQGEEDKGRVHAFCAQASVNNREAGQHHANNGAAARDTRTNGNGLQTLRDGLALALAGVDELIQARR